MKHIFIVNPAAGKCDRSVQIRNTVDAVLGKLGVEYDVLISKHPGDCTRLAREAAETGDEVRLYACGGDGTLNEVINGIVGFDNVAVTHYPAGSGNDFVKIFDDRQAFRDLERLMDCEETKIDLVECRTDDKVCYANNIVSLGLDARIAADMGRFRRMPLVSGNSAYYLATASNLFKGIHKPYEIEVNGECITGNQTMICVCNGRCYGSSFNPLPDAEPDDGSLDVLLVKPVNLMQIAMVIGKYQEGKYAEFPELIRHLQTDKIRIRCFEDSVVNLDGECLRTRDITFSISEHKLRFFYPRGLVYHAQTSNAAAL